MTSPESSFKQGGRIAELDGVRGMAILFVLMWHYVCIPNGLVLQPDKWIPSFNQSLIIFKTGVDLFFVLSGYLIGRSLIENRHRGNYFGVFFGRRVCRIAPLYFSLVLAYVALRSLGRAPSLVSGSVPTWSYFAFVQNYAMASMKSYGPAWLSATWSLAIEEQFYLVFPFIVRWSGRRLILWLVLGILSAPVFRILAYRHFGDDWASYTWLPCRIDALCWGALGAHLLGDDRTRAGLNRNRGMVLTAFAMLGLGVVALTAALPRDIAYHMSFWGEALMAAFYGLMIMLVVLAEGSSAVAGLRNRMLSYLGRLSYGVYLLHGIVLAAAFVIGARWVALPRAVVPPVALVVTLSIAAASYRWLEIPFLVRGSRLKYR